MQRLPLSPYLKCLLQLLNILPLLFHLHCAHFPGSNFVSLPLFPYGAQMEIIMAAEEEGKKHRREEGKEGGEGEEGRRKLSS